MNNVPWLAPENPQQLFILTKIFILQGGVTTPINVQTTDLTFIHEKVRYTINSEGIV